MSSDGSTPSSNGSSSSRSDASTTPSSVDSAPSGSPSPSAASTPASSVASSPASSAASTPASSAASTPASSAASTPASSVTSTPASTAPSSPAGSRAPSPTLKPQPKSQLSEPQPTCELKIPNNDALHLLLKEIGDYSLMKCIAEHQSNTAKQALAIRKGKKGAPSKVPRRFHQLTKAEQDEEVDGKFKETLEAIMEMDQKYELGIYDHDYDDSFGDKSRPKALGISGVYFGGKVSQMYTNKIVEMANETEHDPVASQTLTSTTTNDRFWETDAIRQMEPAVSVLASLVTTVNPYDEDDRIYSQFTPSFQKLIKTGFDMVDRSPKTPWPAGERHEYEQKREGLPPKRYRSAMRKPAVFDTLGMGESNEMKSLRTHFDTVGSSSPERRKHLSDFARSAGFKSTNRDSTDTQTQTAQTTALPESGPSNNGLSNASNKPRRVTFADQSQTADAGTASDGRPQRKEDRDKELREEFEKFRRRQASQTATSCAQEAGISQTGLAQTGSLASYG